MITSEAMAITHNPRLFLNFRKVLITVTICLISTSVFSQGKSDSLLNVLKQEISKAPVYDQQKELRILNLKRKLNKGNSQYFLFQHNLYKNIIEEYKAYKYDSAFVYANKMIALASRFNKKHELIEDEILLGNIYTSTGMYKEGFELVANIDTNTISDQLKSDFYSFRGRLNEHISKYNKDAFFSELYLKQSHEDFARSKSILPPNSFEKTVDQAFIAKDQQLPALYFYDYIIHSNLTLHELAKISNRLSSAFEGDEKVLFLALAAICDLRSSIKETKAMFFLGQEMFRQNKTEDAYLFIQHAVKDAEFYGSRSNQVQIESILPIIAEKLISEEQNEKNQYVISLLVFLVVALVLGFILFIYKARLRRIKTNQQLIRNKNDELAIVNEKLLESSRIKEEFIGVFFKNCSSYIGTLDKIKHKVKHHLKSGNYKDADSTLNSINIGYERHKLYETLDTILLALFPNFIVAFNALLPKEDQIWPKNNEPLNPSIRIFALIRFGVTEIESIAKILDYRVSTVYTYKMRIKSKALVEGDGFEKKIMEIKLADNN